MKNILFYILLGLLISCSNKERQGLKEKDRNYDPTVLDNTTCLIGQPSDGIYIFKEDIHATLTNRLIQFSDSVLGTGFIEPSDLSDIQEKIYAESHKFQYPNPDITIDTKNVLPQLVENKGGWSSLEYRESDLNTSSPRHFQSNNVLTWDALQTTLEIENDRFEVEITTNICMDTLITKKGIYTINYVSEKSLVPSYKYHGKFYIDIKLEILDNNNGKTEYYITRIPKFCYHYTAMQYSPYHSVSVE